MHRQFNGTALRTAREGKGLTRELLAHRVGRTASAVYSYETGHRAPSAGTLVELIDVLNVSLDVLFTTADGASDVAVGE